MIDVSLEKQRLELICIYLIQLNFVWLQKKLYNQF